MMSTCRCIVKCHEAKQGDVFQRIALKMGDRLNQPSRKTIEYYRKPIAALVETQYHAMESQSSDKVGSSRGEEGAV